MHKRKFTTTLTKLRDVCKRVTRYTKVQNKALLSEILSEVAEITVRDLAVIVLRDVRGSKNVHFFY